MNKEEKLLISLCRAYLYGTNIKIEQDTDFTYLFRLARHHNLLGLLYCVINANSTADSVPDAFLKELKNSFLDYMFIAQRQSLALDELDEAMSNAGVKYIIFKGAVLRELYPVSESRAMGDIDFLIKKEDIACASKALKNAGFVCTADNGAVHDYRKNDVLLEMHNIMLEDYGEKAFADAFENAEFNGAKGVLYPSYHLAYLIAHTAHHFKYYGAGIKLILDLAVLQNNFEIDYDEMFSLLDKINLRKFAEIILSVCNKWFDSGRSYTQSTEAVEAYITNAGAFGSLLDNKSVVLTRRDLEEGKNASALLTSLRLAFPSYEKLRRLKYISFIDGRPWLTPVAWGYRFIYTAKNRRSFTKKAVSSLGEKQTIIEAEKQLSFFEEIGL